jgi:hypothetical protein
MLIKGAKNQVFFQTRSFSTKSKKSDNIVVQLEEEYSKESEILAKH